jgi:hypothetical protein
VYKPGQIYQINFNNSISTYVIIVPQISSLGFMSLVSFLDEPSITVNKLKQFHHKYICESNSPRFQEIKSEILNALPIHKRIWDDINGHGDDFLHDRSVTEM